jgi:hypothetical protein
MSKSSKRYIATSLLASVVSLPACNAQQSTAVNPTKSESLNAKPSMTTSATSSPVSKEEVMDFLRRFMVAVETDAFADPKKIKDVLGLETSDWTIREMDLNLGTFSFPQSWKFRDAWLNQSKDDSFAHFNSSNYIIRNYDSVARYSASVFNLDKVAVISVDDIRSRFGKVNLKKTPWIGSIPLSGGSPARGWHITLEYDFPVDIDKKILRFEFNHDQNGNPLDLKRVSVTKSTEFIERERLKEYERRSNAK